MRANIHLYFLRFNNPEEIVALLLQRSTTKYWRHDEKNKSRAKLCDMRKKYGNSYNENKVIMLQDLINEKKSQ